MYSVKREDVKRESRITCYFLLCQEVKSWFDDSGFMAKRRRSTRYKKKKSRFHINLSGLLRADRVGIALLALALLTLLSLASPSRGALTEGWLHLLRLAFVSDAPADIEEHVVTAGNAPGSDPVPTRRSRRWGSCARPS